MTWSVFIFFASAAVILWAGGSAAAMFLRRKMAIALIAAGILVYSAFIAGFWITLGRPPLRTTGETRLWYSFFMMLSAMLTYIRWGYRWIPAFSLVVATVFICLNLFRPEIHDESLMPALQSWWFIPHVTVYMFSYSLLGCAFILACVSLFRKTDEYLPAADTLVYIGLAFLSLGMLSGSLWAKQAWGTYWNWDPKETWAAITWCIYLIYIHLRLVQRNAKRGSLAALLIAGFIGLQMCWWGVNYLPSAQDSQHVYSGGR